MKWVTLIRVVSFALSPRGILVVGLIGLVALLAAFTPPQPQAPASAAGTGGSCYPLNQYSYNDLGDPSGPAFQASGAGMARFSESEIQFPYETPYDGPGGRLLWMYREIATTPTGAHNTPYGGSFAGSVSAIILWDDGTLSIFRSGCVAEVQTIYDCGEVGVPCRREAEMEAEGTLIGFPDGGSSPQPAVASLQVKYEEGTRDLLLGFSVELGTTCFEGDTAEAETEFGLHAGFLTSEGVEGGSGHVLGYSLSPPSTSGAWSFPDGHDYSNCPGAY